MNSETNFPETPPVVPRWEWRTFGQDFGESEALINQYPCLRVKESREIYILSSNAGDNCKIRNSQIDIKVLERIDAQRLELWKPLLKAAFPINREIVRLLMRTLHVRKPMLLRERYTHHQFIDNIIKPHPKLTAVNVHKLRRGFNVEGVEIELADLKINRHNLRSVAIEHENPELVAKMLEKLGLKRFTNVNYISALKKLLES